MKGDYYSSHTLKRIALKQLRGNTFICVQVVLLSYFLTYILYLIMSSVIPYIGNQTFMMIYDLFCYFIVAVILGIFAFGRKFFILNIAAKNPYRFSDCFYGFRNYTGKVFAISFIRGIINLILIALPWLVLSFLSIIGVSEYIPKEYIPHSNTPEYEAMIAFGKQLTAYINLENLSYRSWAVIYYFALFFMMLSLSAYIWILITFDQTERLLLYYPSKSVLGLMQMSADMMRGHKLNRFYMMVSFIPHNIVSLFTFGAGFLLVIPYKESVYTNYFLDLRANEYKQ